MTSRRARVRTRDIVIGGVLLVGLVLGVVLVVTGGSSDDAPDETDGGTTATLPLEDVSLGAIEEWSGLDVPDGAEGFLTARIGDAQLDVTFTMASDDETAFVADSGLPDPVAGERLVLHSSPLWKLNPGTEDDGGSTPTDTTVLDEAPDAAEEVVPDDAVRATSDTYDEIHRTVELVDEGAGTVRARVVLSVG